MSFEPMPHLKDHIMKRTQSCRHPAAAWASLVLAGSLLLTGLPEFLFAQEENSFAGTYRDEQVLVELSAPTRSGEKDIYTGTIQLGTQKFPLRAEAQEARLKGTFESQGDHFEFTGSIVGRMFVLTTEGTTYRLKKQTANPLARPSMPNPLAQAPRTNQVPAARILPNPSPSAPTNSTPKLALENEPSANTIRLKPCSVIDNANIIGGEAFNLLAPVDWRVEGGVGWRMYPAAPAFVAMRVTDPGHSEAWEVFPTIPFVWGDERSPEYPAGSKYLGNEVAEPIENPVDYVKRVLLPRFRRDVSQPQIVATEELPKVAEIIRENSQEPGVERKLRAMRVRLEYLQGGKMMQEDIYCVLAQAYAPAIKTTLWRPERNYSFKAEKGKLDARTRVFQTMVNSFKPNLRWFNRYVQLVQLLLQNQPDTARPASDLSLFVARTSDEINEARRRLYEQQQRTQAGINAAFGLYVRGLEEFRSPFDSGAVQLPSGYRQAWANPLGEYALSDAMNFNPNTVSDGRWVKLDRNR